MPLDYLVPFDARSEEFGDIGLAPLMRTRLMTEVARPPWRFFSRHRRMYSR